MSKSQNSIRISPTEKEMYRIFKDLERYGRATFCYPEQPSKQSKIARNLGMKAKPLVEKELFFPPTVTRWHKPPINAIQLPTNVKIVEKKNKGYSRFYFKKI